MAEKSAENVGNELLRDENDDFDHISPLHSSCDAVMWVEETVDLRQKSVKKKVSLKVLQSNPRQLLMNYHHQI